MDEFWNDESWDNDDDESDDQDDPTGGKMVANHILLLLDCSKAMFDPVHPDPDFPNDDKISSVQFVVQKIHNAVKQKIRQVSMYHTGKRDSIGVLLYNTKFRLPLSIDETNEAEDKRNTKRENGEQDFDPMNDEILFGVHKSKESTVHELLQLHPPGAKAVFQLRKAVPDIITNEAELDLEKEFCIHDTDDDLDDETNYMNMIPLRDALSEAQKYIAAATSVKESDYVQIVIVTASDLPTADDITPVLPVLQRTVKNLIEHRFEMVVWPMVSETSWDASKFYDKIAIPTMIAPIGDDNEVPWSASVLKATRRSYRVPLLLPNWKNKDLNILPKIHLDLYKVTQDLKIPRGVPIHIQTGKRLSRLTEVATESGKVLYRKAKFAPTQPSHDLIRQFYDFGGELVPFSDADKIAIKRQCNANPDFPSLVLLGFKLAHTIPSFHILKHSFVCVPNEEACAGGSDAMVHLHARMLHKKVVGIGELLYRSGAVSHLVVLEPLPMNDVHGLLRLVRIPFEEEVRAMVPDKASEVFAAKGESIASDAMIEAAVNLVERWHLQAQVGEDFENPAIETYWDYVESVALEEEVKAKRYFDTEIDPQLVENLAGKEITSLASLLPEDEVFQPSKRKVSTMIETDDTGIDWEMLHEQGNLSQCTVSQLKKKLGAHGMKKTGNKSELIANVTAILDTNKSCPVFMVPNDRSDISAVYKEKTVEDMQC